MSQLLERLRGKDEELINIKTQLLKFQTDASISKAEQQTFLQQLAMRNQRIDSLNKEVAVYRSQMVQLEQQAPSSQSKQEI